MRSIYTERTEACQRCAIGCEQCRNGMIKVDRGNDCPHGQRECRKAKQV